MFASPCLPKNGNEKLAVWDFFARNGLQSGTKCDIIPSLRKHAPLAQLDRAQASDAWCRRFESAMVCQKVQVFSVILLTEYSR